MNRKYFQCTAWMLLFLPSVMQAQFNNPLKAAKDAYNKAKQQQQQQQTAPGQKPPAPGQKPGAASAASANTTGPFTPPPGTKIEPTLLAPSIQGAAFTVSPHGLHMATITNSGSRKVVIYDGVEGPKFDQFYPSGTYGATVVFSPDGLHYAYAGRVGTELIVMQDGKEIFRSPRTNSRGVIDNNTCSDLAFTKSNHLRFRWSVQYDQRSAMDANIFVFDGKPDAIGNTGLSKDYIISPDGNHYAYLWGNLGANLTQKLIVDGKVAPYLAGNPQWSADSQHLYTTATIPNTGEELLLDGKPVLRTNHLQLFIPPVGNMALVLLTTRAGNGYSHSIWIGGKVVPGSEQMAGNINDNVTFSPDGKHYAAQYTNPNGHTSVFSDGKRGLEYGRLDPFADYLVKKQYFFTFTGPPVTVIYMGDDGDANQFVVDGSQESGQIHMSNEVTVSPTGNHYMASGLHALVVDGNVRSMPTVDSIRFLGYSPDGQHAAVVVRSHVGATFVLDGNPQPAYTVLESNDADYVFSPDSKHVAYFCRPADPSAGNDAGVCLDGTYVSGGPAALSNLTFSADSNHLFWIKTTGPNFRIFADGKPVYEGGAPATSGFAKEIWQTAGTDGIIVLSHDDAGYERVSITPATSLANVTGMGAQVGGSH